MSGQLKRPRSVIAQVVFCILLSIDQTLTRAANSVHEKKIYGNWQVRQNQRYCRQVLYCQFREAKCTQVRTANTWTCNRINTEIAERGCVMTICKTDLKMVCAATSPGLEYQETSSDSCPVGEQCYVKVTPQTTTPEPVRTSPATLTPGASTSSPVASTQSPVPGPSVTTASSTQNGAVLPTMFPLIVPGATTVPIPAATTAAVNGATTASVSGATTSAVSGATTAPLPRATTAAVSGATTAPLPGATTAAVSGATTASLPGATTAAVSDATTAPLAGATTAAVSGATTAPLPGATTAPLPGATTAAVSVATTAPIFRIDN